jgi:hypothetical protein
MKNVLVGLIVREGRCVVILLTINKIRVNNQSGNKVEVSMGKSITVRSKLIGGKYHIVKTW